MGKSLILVQKYNSFRQWNLIICKKYDIHIHLLIIRSETCGKILVQKYQPLNEKIKNKKINRVILEVPFLISSQGCWGTRKQWHLLQGGQRNTRLKLKGWKFVQIFRVTRPRWLAGPYMVKTLKKSPSSEPRGRWPWNLVYSFTYSGTTKIVQMITLG